jgi:tRNA wybutosine-synthesizing protein 4
MLDTGIPSNTPTLGRGIIAGGVSVDAIFEQGIWDWELVHDPQHPILRFGRSSMFPDNLEHQQFLARFGASVVNHKDGTYILGGIVKDELLGVPDEICAIDAQGSLHTVSRTSPHNDPAPQPLLVGATVMSTNGNLLITGGGATCFSFGTFW